MVGMNTATVLDRKHLYSHMHLWTEIGTFYKTEFDVCSGSLCDLLLLYPVGHQQEVNQKGSFAAVAGSAGSDKETILIATDIGWLKYTSLQGHKDTEKWKKE